MWSLKTAGILPQVNYSGKCTLRGLKGWSLNTGGLSRPVVLRTGSTVDCAKWHKV